MRQGVVISNERAPDQKGKGRTGNLLAGQPGLAQLYTTSSAKTTNPLKILENCFYGGRLQLSHLVCCRLTDCETRNKHGLDAVSDSATFKAVIQIPEDCSDGGLWFLRGL